MSEDKTPKAELVSAHRKHIPLAKCDYRETTSHEEAPLEIFGSPTCLIPLRNSACFANTIEFIPYALQVEIIRHDRYAFISST